MAGSIFITSQGYDPESGLHVKDPYLGNNPTMGACRPDLRKRAGIGDHIFVISGRTRGLSQFVMGGLEVGCKIHASSAYQLFPERRLHLRQDGQLDGNVIVDADGAQHPLDQHRKATIHARFHNYIVGKNAVALTTPEEIALGRQETMAILQEIFGRSGRNPIDIVKHYGKKMTVEQVAHMLDWLLSVKRRAILDDIPASVPANNVRRDCA